MRTLVFALAACGTAASAPPSSDDVTAAPPHVATSHAPGATHVLGDSSSAGRIVSARVLAAVDDGAASEQPAYARVDQRVTLYALIEVERDGHRVYFSDAPHVRLHGRAIAVLPLARAPRVALAWNRIEPATASLSNTDEQGGNFHFQAIDYRATPIVDAGGASLRADVRPTLTPDHGQGVGTMRFQVVVTPAGDAGHAVASAGTEARRGRGSGGLTDDVLRVSIRRDDTYLGFLTEMFGQPYIWASAGLTDATHQSERLEGADCADFVVYGARRAGKHVAYTWTGGLPAVTKLLASGARGAGGIYRDAHGAPVPFTRAGDLIVFPRHVGALVEDRGTLGVLDDQDLVVHILFDTPKQEPLADTGYADKPIELRRFR